MRELQSRKALARPQGLSHCCNTSLTCADVQSDNSWLTVLVLTPVSHLLCTCNSFPVHLCCEGVALLSESHCLTARCGVFLCVPILGYLHLT